MTRPRVPTLALLLLSACGAPAATPPAGGPEPDAATLRGTLPPVPSARGALRLDLVYPAEGAALTASDSNFVFGSTGTGAAELRIDGARVPVAANGAFLAFLPVPADGSYDVEASAGGERATLTRRVRAPGRPSTSAAPEGEAPLRAASVAPRAAMTLQAGEPVEVRVRAPAGAQARVVFPDGTSLPLVATEATERETGFMQDASRSRRVTEYAGAFPARIPLLSRDRGVGATTLGRAEARGGTALVELTRGADTTRVPLELSLAVLAPGETRSAVAAGSRPDGAIIGRALPGSGTPYHWTFPRGTRFTVTGEREGMYRVRLTSDLSVWVDAREVRLLPAGLPEARGAVGAVRLTPREEWIDVRLATSDRLPFRVDADGHTLVVTVYGAETRTDWLYYGATDPLLRRAEWEQTRDDLYALRVELNEPVWGWRAAWDSTGALVVRVRRPPRIDRSHPLRGMYVGVDAGHPPGGAIGPTRLMEWDANLWISRRLVRMLREAGARVLETRPDTAAVELGMRPVMAADSGVHLLVSVHNNAFPDGVNPFENAGTTVFYNAPQSLELARGLQAELLAAVGLRDLGIARADLALVRPTWMPSALTETMFLMVPEQEAALRDPDVQERVARAHFRAIEAFFRSRAQR